MSLLEETKFLLRRHRIFPNRLLGQNFLTEPSIFQSLIDYASLTQEDVVLDIGAGLGFLTRFLADNCRGVLAVEADLHVAKALHEQLKGVSNVQIIEGNVLKLPISGFNKVISIPPYSISSNLLLWLFDHRFDCAVLILQKEFAEKLVAPIGTSGYGWLTVLTYYHAEAEVLDAVPKTMFYPQPKVNSTIVRLKPRKEAPFRLENETLFRQMLRSLFNERNKKVKNALVPLIKRKPAKPKKNPCILAAPLSFRDERVRELAPEDFGVLANVLFS
ncbi:MAG: 16S rRNA (adenine(1518)-N(6)/adenine(1519)-N(6))-dimethyltransferase RsmA [Candidatus Bathycorpusculaceae bacterium]